MPQQQSRGGVVARGAFVAGAVTVGTLAAPVASAFAAPAPTGPATKPIVKPKPAQAPNQATPGVKQIVPVANKAVPRTNAAIAPAARPGVVADYSIAPRTQTIQTGRSKAAVVAAALSKQGSPYSYGSAGPNAFDCSGLVQWSMKQGGINVPRDSYGQLGGGTPVSKADLQPGDVIIYNGGSHAAVYIGSGKVVHSVNYGIPVKVSPLDSMSFYAARRY